MSDEIAFIRAARAQPDDDTLRLVYADWLDEQGEATRAAFVRLQVRRARLDVFDPERAERVRDEARLLQKHKRYWNGHVHRALHARGQRGLIDARRGVVRTWDYHRGMVGRVAVTADGLAAHPDVVSELGPVQWLEVSGWRDWSAAETRAVEPLFAGLKVVAVRWPDPPGVTWVMRLRELGTAVGMMAAFGPLGGVPLLDLRAVTNADQFVRELTTGAKAGKLPAVLLRRNVITTRQVRGYSYQDSAQAVHVIDPRGRWDALRLWFADFTGEVLDPIRL